MRVLRCPPADLPWRIRSPRSRRIVRAAQLALILAGCACLSSAARAQQPKAEEYQVKAVYLYNFGRFIEWPAAARNDSSFAVCVLGRDPFGPSLDATLARESIDNRKVIARRVESARDAASCRILFISSSEAARVKEILPSLQKTSALTVSDMPGFLDNGGMIQFVVKENKVRFQVNLAAAEKSGLTLSSQLLKVATDIRKSPGGTDVKP